MRLVAGKQGILYQHLQTKQKQNINNNEKVIS